MVEAKKNAVRAYAAVGEICDAFRSVFGSYTETSVLQLPFCFAFCLLSPVSCLLPPASCLLLLE